MRRLPIHLRAIALLGAGALGVHQLRYVAACRPQAEACTESSAWLHYAGPAVAVLLAIALGGLIAELVRGGRSHDARPRSFAARWLASAGALVTVYAAQELVEGATLAGHVAGPGAVLDAGGWWGLVFAVLIGALVALALKGAEAAVAWAAQERRLRLPRPRPLALRALVAPTSPPVLAVLAGSPGARAPPGAPLV